MIVNKTPFKRHKFCHGVETDIYPPINFVCVNGPGSLPVGKASPDNKIRDLTPKLTDPLWFNVDKPVDDDTELTQLEHDHTDWLNAISQKNCDVVPIGKTAAEQQEDDDDDEEEDNDDDDESDTHEDDDEDEMDMEVSFDRDSPVEVSVIRLGSGSGSVR